jgi:hypothetical protein
LSAIRLLIALPLVAAGTPAMAEGAPEMPQFRPAAFGDSVRSLPAVYQCPAEPDRPVTATVVCRATVTSRGASRAEGSNCRSTDAALSAYYRAAEKALAIAEFVPALVAGKPVAVTMTFRIEIRHAGATCEVSAVPNPGQDEAASNAADVAPQRIIPERRWLALRPTVNALPIRGGGPYPAPTLLVVSMAVAPDGSSSDTVIEQRLPALSMAEAARIVRSLEGSRFIPGQRAGQPVAMRYFHWLAPEWDGDGFFWPPRSRL